MNRTRVVSLLLGLFVALWVAWLLLKALESRGIHLPPVSWAMSVVLGVLAAAVLAGGFVVRAYMRGKNPRLSGLVAARLTVLGKAAAWAGALLAGWYGAQGLAVLPLLEIGPQRDRLWPALVAAGTALALAVAGLITERFGRLPPPSDNLPPSEDVRHHGAHD